MTKKEFIEVLSSMGYVVDSNKLYKIRNSEEKWAIGMKVGEYQHSCHIDTSDISVFVTLKRNGQKHGHLYDVQLEKVWDLSSLPI